MASQDMYGMESPPGVGIEATARGYVLYGSMYIVYIPQEMIAQTGGE